MKFNVYDFSSDALCMGERVKGGRYKPCAKVFRYSQLTGMLKRKFGPAEVHASGVLDKFNIEYLSHTVTDRSSGISKVPLRVEFLTDVIGKVYISVGGVPDEHENEFSLSMGAMISKGFGLCRFKKTNEEIDTETKKPIQGFLNTRLPLGTKDETQLQNLIHHGKPTRFLDRVFGIRKVMQSQLGYLVEPGPDYTASYILSLFEKSMVEAPEFLIQKRSE